MKKTNRVYPNVIKLRKKKVNDSLKYIAFFINLTNFIFLSNKKKNVLYGIVQFIILGNTI
jgi:hypothetical protein